MSEDLTEPPRGYHRLRHDVGLVERSARGLIEISGTDRGAYLQGLLTNDIEHMTSGEGCYATYLTPQGRMIADLDVLNIGDRLLLDVDGGLTKRLVDRLDALVFVEDVRVVDLRDTWSSSGIYGPGAAHLLSEVSGAPISELTLYQSRSITVGDATALVARCDAIGIPGYHLLGERVAVVAIRAAVSEAGATDVDHEAVEAVRVESGRPLFGADMDTETIPLEAGIEDRAISFDKGCYVGQEVIVRILHRGQGRVARRLIGLTLSGTEADTSGAPRPSPTLWHGENAVGRVTSTVHSPALRVPIALGYISRPFAEPGTEVEVGDAGARRGAVVTALPFVSPGRG